jgi:carbonic anhydrase
MASSSEDELRARLSDRAGVDASWMSLGVIDDQEAAIRKDVDKVVAHPLVGSDVTVGGFLYDVDTGLLRQIV